MQPARRAPPLPPGAAASGSPLRAAPGGSGRGARYALEWGVGLSLAFHALALSLHFVMPESGATRHHDQGLEVVLVNSRHARQPAKAELLAQTSLDGGGNSETAATPATPLPPQELTRVGDSLVEAQRRSEAPHPSLLQALTTARSRAALAVDFRQLNPSESVEQLAGYDQLDSSAAVARIEAQIDKDLVDYASRPRKKFIGARAQEYRFAQYVENWRQKIERVGTLNYPPAARGKFYGSLLLSITIRADGSIHSIDIPRSSGIPVLDAAARRIVELAAPYPPFPPEISRDSDELTITRTWTFTPGDTLQTSDKKE